MNGNENIMTLLEQVPKNIGVPEFGPGIRIPVPSEDTVIRRLQNLKKLVYEEDSFVMSATVDVPAIRHRDLVYQFGGISFEVYNFSLPALSKARCLEVYYQLRAPFVEEHLAYSLEKGLEEESRTLRDLLVRGHVPRQASLICQKMVRLRDDVVMTWRTSTADGLI